jgi:Holliday junction DNA helicase RuvA
MIGAIRGTLREKRPPAVLVECGGVCYEVLVPLSALSRLPQTGAEVFLRTELVVREDAHTLYGFSEWNEREMFRRLIRVSGVGAKMALAMMSGMSAAEIAASLAAGDVNALTRLPGIGKKIAERLVLELADSAAALAGGATAPSPIDAGVENALAALGYRKAEIRRAVDAIPADAPADIAARVRAALRILSGRR